MKKLIYSALAAGAALAVAFSGSAAVNAEETTPAEAKSAVKTADFALVGDTMVITGVDASKVMVGVGKEKNSVFSTSAWDLYNVEAGAVKVDLSKINKTKDAYLMVKADFEADADAYIVKVPASDAIKGTYDKKTGKITVTDTSTKSAYEGSVNFRTESNLGGVSSISTLDVSTYQMSGGVIYLSTAQSAGAADAKANVVLDKRPSKEAKVTIGKLANAPKVKANYATGEVTVPKNAVYSTQVKGAAAAAPATVTAATVLTLGEDIVATDDFAVDVFTPADSSKGKLQSKTGRYVFPKQAATTVDKLTDYKEETDAKGKVTVTFKNDSDDSYLVLWWANGKTDPDKVKKTTVKDGKPATLKDIATGAGIAVQRVGNSKKGSEAWAGNKVKFKDGTNVADYAAPGQSSGGGAAAKAKHSITTTGSEATHATVAAEAEEDSTVSVTFSKKVAAYDTIQVKDAEGTIIEYTAAGENEITFTMPQSDVTIKVVL